MDVVCAEDMMMPRDQQSSTQTSQVAETSMPVDTHANVQTPYPVTVASHRSGRQTGGQRQLKPSGNPAAASDINCSGGCAAPKVTGRTRQQGGKSGNTAVFLSDYCPRCNRARKARDDDVAPSRVEEGKSTFGEDDGAVQCAFR
ncbi:hypothetical protein UVI_02040590 [Ustilaginoidea virens]|uniref:Uncharacterized protein n=1 Tax=Ustilaginoidea virens TaxID=1159556 RepID=A0A1B5L7L9_USTVR|nr:hypothetical protein UVI_02040590 [Ustilaginoidea virens]